MELPSKQKKILVLDNGERMLSVLNEIMFYGDFDIHTIYDPAYICEKAKAFNPDLIILDYKLLNKECENVCRDLKEEASSSNIPVIIISTYRNKKIQSDAYKCDALFLKPMDMQVLASRMDYLMAS